MAKFRILTHEELESMEKEFIDFLVLNGITGEDWTRLKEDNIEKADGICEAFSDVVFTKILKNCRYIEHHLSNHIITVYCDDQKMHLLGIEAPLHLGIDFTDKNQFEKLKNAIPEGLIKISSEKVYSKERELEIWEMLNKGFFISDQKLYMALYSFESE